MKLTKVDKKASQSDRFEEDNLCVSALHIVYDIVYAETKLRRAEWHHWSAIISWAVVDKLYLLTGDAAVRAIASLQEDLWCAEPKELAEMNEASLLEIEEKYKCFRNSGIAFFAETVAITIEIFFIIW